MSLDIKNRIFTLSQLLSNLLLYLKYRVTNRSCQQKIAKKSNNLIFFLENMGMDNFITRLQSVLKEKKISQTELAQELGIRRENFTYWKANNTLPNGDILINLANFLEVDPYWLVKGEYQNKDISATDQAHLNKFKQLTPRDKKIVSSLCDILLNEKALSSCGEGQEPNLEKI